MVLLEKINPFRCHAGMLPGRDRETDRSSDDGQVLQVLYSSAADQANQNHDDGDNQQDVDEATNGVRRDQAEQPQDQEYDGDCIEHDVVLGGLLWTT
jgi:hypothetical protein